MTDDKKTPENVEIDEKVAQAFSEIKKENEEALEKAMGSKVEETKKTAKKPDNKKTKKVKPLSEKEKKRLADKKEADRKAKAKKEEQKKLDEEKARKRAEEQASKEIKAQKKKSAKSVRKDMAKKRRDIKKRNRKQFRSVIKDLFDAIERQYKRIDSFIKSIFSVFGLVIDKSINSKTALKVIAFVFAVLLYIFVVEAPESNKITGQPELIYDVPVEIINVDEFHVVEGLPELADMLLVGSNADLMRAVNLKDYRVYIDLNGLGPGTHEVELRYSNLVTDIDVTLTPAKVTLQIFKKVGDSLTLIPERIKIDKKDPKLVLTDIVLDTSEVTVRGADYQIEKIVSVKALIDVSQIQNTGEIILENNQIIAYDSKGMPVDVEIFPSTVSATITVDAPFKVVPITIKTIGELEAGFAVEDFVIEPQNVTLYAPQEDLDGITSFEIEVDLSQYTINDNLDNIVKQFTIEKPSKVNQMLEGQVSVTASFSSETELLIENVPINGINIPDGLSVYGKTEDDVVVDVLIKGSSTLLSEITLDDIVIEVDLTNLEAGEHQVDLIISGTDPKLEYELQKVKVTMILEEE